MEAHDLAAANKAPLVSIVVQFNPEDHTTTLHVENCQNIDFIIHELQKAVEMTQEIKANARAQAHAQQRAQIAQANGIAESILRRRGRPPC